MRVVIVGGGFAGVKAALELSRRRVGKITLISNQPYFLHHATLYATATGRSLAESVLPLENIFLNHPDVKVVTDTISKIDTGKRVLMSAKNTYPYDEAILALGSVTSFFGIEGLADHAFGVKSLQEIKKYHNHLHDRMALTNQRDNHYVIGGGATGVELAGAVREYLDSLAHLHHQHHSKNIVHLVEAADRLVPQCSLTASKLIHRRLEKMNVIVKLHKHVTALDDDTIDIDGEKHRQQSAVWTSGVANHPFFARQPIGTFKFNARGRIVVNDFLQAAPHVYVLGDNNAVPDSGLAWPAMRQGKFTAINLSRQVLKKPLRRYKPSRPPVGIPVGENWAYVEWKGVYAAGRLGAWLRRRMELYGYRQLMPAKMARAVWRAHDIQEIDG